MVDRKTGWNCVVSRQDSTGELEAVLWQVANASEAYRCKVVGDGFVGAVYKDGIDKPLTDSPFTRFLAKIADRELQQYLNE